MNIPRNLHVASLGVLAVLLAGPATLTVAADDPTAAKLKKWDPDADGTLDLKEVNAAAEPKFVSLDPDKDGTLDEKEAAGAKISKAQLIKADPDKDGTLDKAEYLHIVEERFKAADPDHDGTVDLKELQSPAGKSLMAMLE